METFVCRVEVNAFLCSSSSRSWPRPSLLRRAKQEPKIRSSGTSSQGSSLRGRSSKGKTPNRSVRATSSFTITRPLTRNRENSTSPPLSRRKTTPRPTTCVARSNPPSSVSKETRSASSSAARGNATTCASNSRFSTTKGTPRSFKARAEKTRRGCAKFSGTSPT